MANPTKPKDAKPKAENEEYEIKSTVVSAAPNSGTSLMTTIGIVIIASLIIIAANFIIFDMKMAQVTKKISAITAMAGEESNVDADESVSSERGIILDLGEFILNLSDANSRRFLKVNVAVELTKKPSDTPAPAKGGGHGHGGGAPDPMAAVEAEMNQFKPSIRDSIISVLSAKTSDELNTTAGKELAKEQIKESIDAIFEGDREVLRVSFGSFFIQ